MPALPKSLPFAFYVGLGSLLSMASLAAVAAISGTPFIFPSLGPTAYLLYFAPKSTASTPRACMLGHAIALVCGYFAFRVSGLPAGPDAMAQSIAWAHVAAAGIALGLTCFFLVLFKIDHPPAGATTLIVALGLITQPWQLAIMEIAVGVLLIQAILLNKLFWKSKTPSLYKTGS